MAANDAHQLGQDAEVYRFDNAQSCYELCLALVQQAKRSIKILSPDLDRGFYDRPEIVEALSAFARNNRFAELHILVADAKSLVANSHALVSLVDRLPSKMKIRTLNPDYPNATCTWLLADRYGLMYRKDPTVFQGFVNFSDAGHVKQFDDEFEAMWQRASDSPDLRRIHI